MKKIIKADSLLIYFILSLFFMETIFRTQTLNDPFNSYLLLSFLFLSSFAFITFIICSFFNKVSQLLAIMFLGIFAFMYSSQLIYYKFFKTFYSAYSLGNGGQVVEFWKDVTVLVGENAGWIILMFVPVLFLIVFGRKIITFEKIDWLNRLSLICCIILIQIVGISVVNNSGKEANSAYDLYYQSNFPLLSVDRLGLLTTMRIDVQRLVTDWSPAMEAVAPIEDYLPAPAPKPSEEDQEAPVDEEKEDEKIEYNTMDINFTNLYETEKNKTVKEMHNYFNHVQPTKKNDYTGKYKGYNLIFITAEGFSPYAVNKEVTPTLYKLVHEGYQFTNFYNPIWGVSTSDGEYVATQSLVPAAGIWSFEKSSENKLPFVMGNQLKKFDYKTMAYHNHTYTYYSRHLSHPNMGYEYKGLGNGLDVKETWPESDLEMFEKTIPEYINNQPFHAYYMTVSGHMQYSFSGNYIAWKNKKLVEHLQYSEQAKAYLATQIELDRSLEHLLAQLEAAGIADNTLIALSADHYPYGLEEKTIDELAGHTVERNFELYKSPFILYTKGMSPEVINKPTSSLDILPTLSNLLGLEYDSRLMMGKDVFSDSDPLVLFLNKSFITDKGYYNAVTQEFKANEDVVVDSEYVKQMSSIVQSKFYYSAKILETNYYEHVIGE